MLLVFNGGNGQLASMLEIPEVVAVGVEISVVKC